MHSTNSFGEFAHRTAFRRHGDALVTGGQNAYSASMDRLFDFLVPAVLLAVLSALGVGLYALFRGGDFNRSYSNKLMRLRVVLQFAAILVLVAAFWWRTR
jgi:drug/metabolite transporter (DMT)-like permease